MRPRPTGHVVGSHAIARRALAAAGGFGLVALTWAVVVLITGGSWWGPLHAFVAGTVLLAISGASQMFTITWATTSPPPPSVSTTQRLLIVIGVTLVLIGVPTSTAVMVWIGAAAVVGGIGTLALSIRAAVHRSLLRRFDLSARFYLVAFTAGAIGVTLGAFLGTGSTGSGYATARLVHSHLNLVGLIGLTIVGTIPTFLPTTAHHRSVSGREAVVAWWLCAAGAAAMTAGLTGSSVMVGAGTVLAGTGAALILGGIVGRLWSKGRREPLFLQISAGVTWLIVWAMVDGIGLMAGRADVPFSGWTAAAVVAGVGQVLLGSLGYLTPVLLGPPPGIRAQWMTRWPVIPLAVPTIAGLALVSGWTVMAVTAVALWIGDFLTRLAGAALVSKPAPSPHGG